ncbi:MAG: hypothetical protein RMK60_02770 [Burkholderiales bacterium]|nr:hypothetical protein [Burkholderiales bacterium]
MTYALMLIALAGLGFVAHAVLTRRRQLHALWREPVLRRPVLIIESDDWGAGPVAAQAEALHRLVDLLTRFHDCSGRHPVVTLAMVLAVPDGPAIRRTGHYHRLTLEHPMFAPVLAAIERGCKAGVFALQLHGLEHYWPPALMASDEPEVRTWREADPPALTECLPPHLQSRWTDASALPSRPLAVEDIWRAVRAEVALFIRVFGARPRVAVPPTFVWNETVEAAWAAEGIEVVSTPGLRSSCRNAAGLPDCDSPPLRNLQSDRGVRYVVRDDYFEPERGHRAEDALRRLLDKWSCRRPCLLETHRSNFLGTAADTGRALAEIERLLSAALTRLPDLRFMSTAELAQPGAQVWTTAWPARLSAFLRRVTKAPGFRRLAVVTLVCVLTLAGAVVHAVL